jgi:hypothetical protein
MRASEWSYGLVAHFPSCSPVVVVAHVFEQRLPRLVRNHKILSYLVRKTDVWHLSPCLPSVRCLSVERSLSLVSPTHDREGSRREGSKNLKKTRHGTMPAGLDLDLIISLTFVGISAYILQRTMRLHDPRVSNERTTKASAVARRLLKGKGKMEIILREHEIEVAADVVCPDDIDVTFAQIGGLSEQAKQLQQAILLPVRRPLLFAQSKLFRSPKGILLHGPPGTGKTMLVRAIAREARFTFLCVNLARLFSKWYGESNKFAEAYFSLARKLAPSLIFIDEVDCVFSKGRNQEHEATSVLKTQSNPPR